MEATAHGQSGEHRGGRTDPRDKLWRLDRAIVQLHVLVRSPDVRDR